MSVGQVFLSAVSSEFRDARQEFSNTLRKAKFEVVVQEDFTQRTDADTTLKKLDAYIGECRAVICVVGDRPGALPAPGEENDDFQKLLPSGFETLSYTQWELILALHHGREIFLYLANPDYHSPAQAAGPEPTPEELTRQRDFRSWIENQAGLDRNYFSSLEELKITYLEGQLAQINGERRIATLTGEGGAAAEAAVAAAVRKDVTSARRLPSNEHSLVGRRKVLGGVTELLLEKASRLTLLLGPTGVGKEAVLREITPDLAELDTYPDGAAISPKLMEPQGIEDLRQAIWSEFYEHPNPSTVHPHRRRNDLDALDALIFLPEFDEYLPHLEDLREDLARASLAVAARDSDYTTGLNGEQIAIKPLSEKLSVELFHELVADAIFEEERDFSENEHAAVAPLCRAVGGLPGQIEILAASAKKELRFEDDPDLVEWARERAGNGDVDRLLEVASPEELRLLRVTTAAEAAVPAELLDVPTDTAEENRLVEAMSPRYRTNPVLAEQVAAMEDFDAEAELATLFDSTHRWALDATQAEIFDNRVFVIRMMRWGLDSATALDASDDDASRARARVRRRRVLDIGRAAESAFALGGRHGAWGELLEIVEVAALAGGSETEDDLGWARHQRGTRALLRDDLDGARRHLFAALPHRRTESARKLTRQNLSLLPLAVLPFTALLFLPLLFAGIGAAALWPFEEPLATLDITQDALFFTDAGERQVLVENVGADTVRLNAEFRIDGNADVFGVEAGGDKPCAQGAVLPPDDFCTFLVTSDGRSATAVLEVDFVSRSGSSDGDRRVLLVSEAAD